MASAKGKEKKDRTNRCSFLPCLPRRWAYLKISPAQAENREARSLGYGRTAHYLEAKRLGYDSKVEYDEAKSMPPTSTLLTNSTKTKAE